MFKLRFATDNDAFNAPDGVENVQQTLRDLADAIGEGERSGIVSDLNGNKIGKWKLDMPDYVETVYQRALAKLPEKVDLVYVSYDDKLMDEQVAKLFGSQEDELSVWEEVDEVFSEDRYRYALEEIKQAIGEEDYDLLDENNRLDDLRFIMQDRDQSNPFRELLGKTPDKVFRYRLDYEVWNASLSLNEAEWAAAVREMGEAASLDVPRNRKALSEMLANADGGVLDVIWEGDVEEMADAVQQVRNGKTVYLEWTNPCLLLIDPYNGGGMDNQTDLVGVTRVKLDLDNLRLDAKGVGHGYSWSQDIAGTVRGAYKADLKITVIENTEGAA